LGLRSRGKGRGRLGSGQRRSKNQAGERTEEFASEYGVDVQQYPLHEHTG
jgi:hypothetical protein